MAGPKTRCLLLGVPIVMVFGDLYWGPPNHANYPFFQLYTDFKGILPVRMGNDTEFVLKKLLEALSRWPLPCQHSHMKSQTASVGRCSEAYEELFAA